MANAAFVIPLPVVSSVGGGGLSTWSGGVESGKVARYAIWRRARMMVDGGSDVSTSITSRSSTIAERKAALFEAVKDLELGQKVLDDEAAQEDVDKLIRALEEVNPTADPADHPLRRARWRLVYTNSPIVLGRNRPGFARPEKLWQLLNMEDGADEGTLTNEEEGSLNMFGFKLRYRNQIVGVCKALRGERIRLKFEKFTLANLFSVPFPGNIVAWQDQVFLDEEVRIARTNFGNVFVLKRDEWDA